MARYSPPKSKVVPLRKAGLPMFSLAIPWRQLAGRLTVALLLTLSFALVILSKTDSDLVRTLRASVTSVMTPLLDVAARPLDAAGAAGDWAGEIVNMRAENLRLKSENAQLQRWQLVAKQMEAENRSLHALMKFAKGTGLSYSTARVVTDAAGPFARTGLINAGSVDGIAKHEAVMNEQGLIGRVVEVNENDARILLITDINSRLPVMGEATREKAILAGNNSAQPQLNYLADDSKITLGERIITAGDGKLVPPGLPVGTVVGIDGGDVKVQPLADWSRLEYVSVVHQ